MVSTLAGNGTQGYADGISTVATFNFPIRVAADSIGNVYISDRNNHRSRKLVQSSYIYALATSLSDYVTTATNQTISGSKTFTTSVNTPSITTPTTGNANMVAVAYGNVLSNAINSFASSSGNYTLSHTSTGIYTIIFTSNNLSGVSISTLPVIISVLGTTPGFVTWSSPGTGVPTIYTFNSSGVAADRGVSFAVYKP